MHDPRSGHVDVVYRILRYLKSSPEKGIIFKSHRHLFRTALQISWRVFAMLIGISLCSQVHQIQHITCDLNQYV
jgi:hypothetical protein